MDFEIPERTKVILEMTREFTEKEVYFLEADYAQAQG